MRSLPVSATISRGFQIQPLSRERSLWRIDYLNDDGSPLEPKPGQHRSRNSAGFHISDVVVLAEIWEAVFAIPAPFEPPPPDTLLLDSFALLPQVGPALVLAAAAVEVRIESALDVLAGEASINGELWAWINDRRDYRKEPSVAEQLGVLMRAVTGESLKDDNRLWALAKNLRDARNSFVHQGRAELAGISVTPQRAYELIHGAQEVIDWIEARLPEAHRRPRRDVVVDAGFFRLITPAAPEP